MSIPHSLAELEAEFVTVGNSGAPRRSQPPMDQAQGLLFLCPECFTKNGGSQGTHSVLVWFRGRGVPDNAFPGPGRWEVEGNGMADLTLRPSIDLSIGAGCKWHGFVTSGSAK